MGNFRVEGRYGHYESEDAEILSTHTTLTRAVRKAIQIGGAQIRNLDTFQLVVLYPSTLDTINDKIKIWFVGHVVHPYRLGGDIRKEAQNFLRMVANQVRRFTNLPIEIGNDLDESSYVIYPGSKLISNA